ncbi:MAG: glycosyltransferase family 2 protein [Lachnospiraceae bacterium]|nr:glycosyltransferase family 2 protein [Lachnospiraceae bacterium]
MPCVIAVVVTYNRKELLIQCLDALLGQSVLVSRILVFNNNSTDGTEKLFEPGSKYHNEMIEVINSEKNLGGAGGFSKGMQLASEQECDWIWCMDDDTIPEKTALEELLNSIKFILEQEKRISFLSSYVYGPNEEPMNVPKLRMDKCENGYSFWYKYLDKGLVPVSQATFVSILISKRAMIEVGYPIADYFIWGDDTEYTRRLIKKYGPAYLCGTSKVLHKRFNSKIISILTEDNKDRVSLYKYYFRNALANAKKFDGLLWMIIRWGFYFVQSFYCLINPKIKFGFMKFRAIQNGIWMYIFKPIRKDKQHG